MRYTEIQDKFNSLWASRIIDIDFNIINNGIKITIEITEHKEKSIHTIEFHGVSSYYFVNNTALKRKEFIPHEDEDFLELTSINYIQEKIKIQMESDEEWIHQFYSEANIVIEIWSRLLFIEANQVSINYVPYQLCE